MKLNMYHQQGQSPGSPSEKQLVDMHGRSQGILMPQSLMVATQQEPGACASLNIHSAARDC